MGEINDFITVGGREIPVVICALKHDALQFYQENPRLYSIIHADEQALSQDDIQERLSSMEHVKTLSQSIKANGGLIDPIIVRKKDNVVLEGNSRLAAYRLLAKQDPIKWASIKCKVLSVDVTDAEIFALLGEYHIIGRKDWAPYEQAGYMYRRHKIQGIPLEDIVKELGLPMTGIKKLVEVFSFMVDHKDTDVNRWSYYSEYLGSRSINKARESYPDLDNKIVKLIKDKKIIATDIRDKLAKFAPSTKIMNNFMSGKNDLDESFQKAEDGGHCHWMFKKLVSFRLWLANPDIDEAVCELDATLLGKAIYELGHIEKRISSLSAKIKKIKGK